MVSAEDIERVKQMRKNDERYRKLKRLLEVAGYVQHVANDSDPFAQTNHIYGDIDAALDTIPEDWEGFAK